MCHTRRRVEKVASRLIVTEGIHDRFVAALTEKLKTLRVDNAINPGTHIGPVVDQKQLQTDMDYIEIGREEGAKLAFGGEVLKRETPGFYLQPALFTEATNRMRISCEEIFGPIASVIRVKDYDEALATANDTPYGLSAGIATTSLQHATHFKRNAEAGLVMVNLPSTICVGRRIRGRTDGKERTGRPVFHRFAHDVCGDRCSGRRRHG